ncbi:MAG: hypothetical protein L0Z73_09140 [Gammaproteobacteria bacterium]|nr:hypothetical protein [Gammaproteobacteria bacterium]
MKVKAIVTALALGMVSTAYAMDTSDVEDISMQPVDSEVELPETEKRVLSLPEMAADKAMERAQQREGYGLSRANMARGVMEEIPGDDDPGDTADDMDDMAIAAKAAAQDAADAAETVANATEMAQEVVSNATEKAQEAVANATNTAQEAIANARNAAEHAAEQAADRRPGV